MAMPFLQMYRKLTGQPTLKTLNRRIPASLLSPNYKQHSMLFTMHKKSQEVPGCKQYLQYKIYDLGFIEFTTASLTPVKLKPPS